MINIVLFMNKISKIYGEELNFLERSKKIFPILKGQQNKLDFWVRRESIRGFYGVLLLILGIVSLAWSFLIISFYHSHQVYKNCDLIIRKMLDVHSMFIFLGNIPIVVLFFSLITVKTFSFISTFTCPDLLICMSKPFKNEVIEAEKA
jgi:hypothetical protein